MDLNYRFPFRRNDKVIFVPTKECDRKADALLRFIEDEVDFPDCFFHYRRGGHVAALHRHIANSLFFRIDIQNFFYSIGRNRVARELRAAGFRNARAFARWSCVKNPVAPNPPYALPIGFKQSTALASLVLMNTPVMTAIKSAADLGVFVSVYLDDIIGSSSDPAALEAAYKAILDGCAAANLIPSARKLVPPASEIQAFNCTLRHGFAEVSKERIARFFAAPASEAAERAFQAYCRGVAANNAAARA